MEHIEEYIKRPQEERQSHLRLNEPCLERGGQSMYLKGLMAHICNTTIPSGKKIHVCHACHTMQACSHPYHIYWGTASENRKDAVANGAKSIWENMVAKYGEEEARRIVTRSSDSARRSGKGNIGTIKTDEHKRKISEALRGRKRGSYKKQKGEAT